MLKSLLLAALILPFTLLANEKGHFAEEVYITNTKYLRVLAEKPELIIDHVSPQGFEVYGPIGTKKYLKMLDIKFEEASKHHHKFVGNYPTFEQIENNLKALEKRYSHIAKLISIGKSVKGRDLYMMKISDNVQLDEVEPEFKYISSMHGDEITGRELTVHLIEDLLAQYSTNPSIKKLIDNTEIYIMPSMNPDGSQKVQRANANGYDLNRNFPDWKRGDTNRVNKRQPETIAIMNFQAKRNFSLSANFHGGAVVVNYPWDNTYDRHPFDNLIKEISLQYAELNPEMKNSSSFSQGITNGADWYKLFGGMQDWSYFWYGDLQVTVELSDRKWPSYAKIKSYYADNKQSMLKYIEAIHQGAGFKFKDFHQAGNVKVVELTTSGAARDRGTYSFGNSEFYKVLPIGQYEFHININGQNTTKVISIAVDEDIDPNGNYFQL